jgi:DNA repair protein RadC
MEESPRHLNIKQLAEDDRPREKMAGIGRQALSDAELLAILIGSGNRNETAVQLARRMLADHGNSINQLARLPIGDLRKFRGVGLAKAVIISAAFELGRRKRAAERKKGVSVGSSAHAFEIFHQHLSDLNHEEMWVLFLSRNNQVIKLEKVSEGGFSGTVVDPKRIFHLALQHKASQLILAHNHPSGNLTPSAEDIRVTEKLIQAGRVLELQVLDHLIVTESSYYSFADEGKMMV